MSEFIPDVNPKTGFIETADVRAIRFVAEMCVDSGEIGLITGSPGTGKSEGLKAVARSMEQPPIMILGFDGINVLRALTTALNLEFRRTYDATFRHIVAVMGGGDRRPILVDEGEKLQYRDLEWLRRIWDMTKAPLILVGTETLYDNIVGARGQRRQLYRRIRARWTMQGLESMEMGDVCAAYGYADHEAIRKLVGSNFDKAINLLNKMDRFARLQSKDINDIPVKEVAKFIIL